MKKLIVFDLDGTLAVSKSPLDAEMAGLLGSLLGIVKVAVISGGAWPQFEAQVLAKLPQAAHLKSLSLLPTCGTQFFQYDTGWKQLYAENFTAAEKEKILRSMHQVMDDTGIKPGQTWGEIIEDRGSQITFSALGQHAPIEAKEKWDPDFAKRKAMRARLAPMLPEFSIGMGGSSSLDVTRRGIDKAYGIAKLHQELGIAIADMLFVGDALFEGGNDFPARRSGVTCIQVAGPSETVKVIETVIGCIAGETA